MYRYILRSKKGIKDKRITSFSSDSLAQCVQEKSKSTEHTSKSGLLIDYGINRGTGYTDSLGTYYNIRYIPITITNDSTIPIHFQIAFSKEYDYPVAYGDREFKVIPLPKEWALDGVEITDRMINELPKYIDKPFSNKPLNPAKNLLPRLEHITPGLLIVA